MSFCDGIIQKARLLNLDECEVVSIQKKISTVRITDSEIAEVKQNDEDFIAVRVIHEKKIMSGKATPSQAGNILERILQAKPYLNPKNFWKSLPHDSKFKPVEKTYDPALENISNTNLVDLANQMINSSLHKNITRISGSLNIVSEHFQIMNSNGLDCSDEATFVAGTITADSEVGNSPVSGVGAISSRTLDSFNPKKVGRDASEMCLDSVNPQTVNQDSYTIILEPYAFGELLAFVFAGNFNLKTYSEKRSCFTGNIGNLISNEKLSVIDDPHFPDGIGSKPFDDEGVTTAPQYLIEHGVFSNLYSDSFDAFKEGTKTSGNAARAGSPLGRSAQPVPVSQPHNLRVVDGKMSKEEIIKDTKNGILVGRLWYTYPVNPERGDFSCTARSGIRIIQNGKIVGPAKSFRVVYNLKSLLNNVSEIGNDSKNVLQWSSLPTVTPSVRVESVPVTPI